MNIRQEFRAFLNESRELNEGNYDFEKKTKFLDKYSDGQIQAIKDMFSASKRGEMKINMVKSKYPLLPTIKGVVNSNNASIVKVSGKSFMVKDVWIEKDGKKVSIDKIDVIRDEELWDIKADVNATSEVIYIFNIGKTKNKLAIKAIHKVEGVCEVPTRKVLFNDSYDKREKLVSSGKLKEAIETSILLAKSGDWKNLMTTEDGIFLDGVFSTEDWKIFYER